MDPLQVGRLGKEAMTVNIVKLRLRSADSGVSLKPAPAPTSH